MKSIKEVSADIVNSWPVGQFFMQGLGHIGYRAKWKWGKKFNEPVNFMIPGVGFFVQECDLNIWTLWQYIMHVSLSL